MHKGNQFNGYIPKVSRKAIFVLRRYAWLQGKPMTVTLDQLILNIISSLNAKSVCAACKGTKSQCKGCPFKAGAANRNASKPPKLNR